MFCALEQRQNNIVTVHWSYDTLALCAYGWKALGASLGVLLTNEKNLMLQKFKIPLTCLYVVGQTTAGYSFKATYFSLYLGLINYSLF